MEVIVLNTHQYKEKDAIVSAISKDQFITFLARCIKDPKNKNAAINTPLTIADIELSESSFKYPILKSSKPLFSPLKLEMDEKYLGTLLLISEIIQNLFPDDEKSELYQLLAEGVQYLKKTNNWQLMLLVFLSNVLRIGGFELEVNRCVICGSKKDIVAFSFIEGGFICQKCYHPDMGRDLDKEQMLLLRKAFNARDYHLLFTPDSALDTEVVLRKTLDFVQEAFGYNFKNLALLFN